MSTPIGELREQNPGKWLLIRLDHSEAEEGVVLAADEDPEAVDRALEQHFRPGTSRKRPLYVTYSIPEGEDLPAVAL